jgi:hypothetical protein
VSGGAVGFDDLMHPQIEEDGTIMVSIIISLLISVFVIILSLAVAVCIGEGDVVVLGDVQRAS